MDEHWNSDDFVVLKVDMKNAFNLVSLQAILNEYPDFFLEHLPWASWCYGTPNTVAFFRSSVLQGWGDQLGPLCFALVLHNIISAIDADGSSIMGY